MYKKAFYLSLIIILMLFSFLTGVGLRTIAEESIAQLADFELIWEVIHIIEDEYVKKLEKPKELVYAAIRGMLESLGDPYTRFLTPRAHNEMKIQTRGEFGGVGISIGMKKVKINEKKEEERVVVIAPLEDTPAYKAGIKSGDWIIKVDDKSVIGFSSEEVAALIRGTPGTKVTLTIKREGVKEELVFPLIRAIIKIKAIDTKKVKYVDKKYGIGFIRIEQFTKQTKIEFKNAVNKLEKEGPFNGLILDLRYNPGGLLDSAAEICDLFLPAGKEIVQIKSRKRETQIIYSTREMNTAISNIPIALLVNYYSASGSEILAGCLQDHKKCIIISSRWAKNGKPVAAHTFGKGSVQTVRALRDDSAVILTTAYYLTAKGKNINEVGITPDIIVELKEEIKTEDIGNPQKDLQLSKAIEVLKDKLTKR